MGGGREEEEEEEVEEEEEKEEKRNVNHFWLILFQINQHNNKKQIRVIRGVTDLKNCLQG